MKTFTKLVIIFLLTLLLGIPLIMIGLASYDRESYKDRVVRDIASNFGGSQMITTPVLVVSYDITKKLTIDNAVTFDKTSHVVYYAPDEIDVESIVDVSIKNRGIYHASVFKSDLKISGVFKDGKRLKEFLNIPGINIKSANLVIRVSDRKGIKSEPKALFAGKEKVVEFNSDSYSSDVFISVNLEDIYNGKGVFNVDLHVNGTSDLKFVATGLSTKITMKGNWPHPSFNGNLLPDSRDVSENGFSALWQSSWLSGHIYGKEPTKDRGSSYNQDFGVSFLEQIDNYSLVTRSLKYGFLIISITFLIIFIIERMLKVRIHPIQYAFIGFALAIFFLLLLSLSEHISFGLAYLIGFIVCVGLIAFYSYFILKNNKTTFLFSGFISILYLAMYILLNMSDYALLVGSILIFIILAIIMVITRKINWYESE